jgi:hypothetical protein
MHTNDDLFGRLAAAGVDVSMESVTLMRHADERYPLMKYIGTRQLELYQASQPKAMPAGSLLVSVFGHRAKHGVLLGVWRVMNVLPGREAVARGLTTGSIESIVEDATWFFHELQLTEILAQDVLRLEIEWPGTEIGWRRDFHGPQKLVTPARLRAEPPVPFMGLREVSMSMSLSPNVRDPRATFVGLPQGRARAIANAAIASNCRATVSPLDATARGAQRSGGLCRQ